MPLYEYGCTACGKVIEALVKMGDRGEGLVCPSCGKTGLEKKISIPAPPSLKGQAQMPSCCGSSEGCNPSNPTCGMGGCCHG